MHLAARIKDGEKVAEMLIKSGADVNAASDVRKSAFCRSCQQTKFLVKPVSLIVCRMVKQLYTSRRDLET